ncbi:MAG: CotH kinase family protein [Flavobacteriales bacterium]|nr:CotH kinase family protein [Flavobacteriales bacterium]
MFRHVLLSLILTPLVAGAQNGVLINELQAANRKTHVATDGGTPDWVELFNPTNVAVDLAGMRFAVVGRTHVIQAPLTIGAGEHSLIWFDGAPDRGTDHAGFTLPRKGGTLLLIAADGLTVQDVFTYPAMAGDLSVGRLSDGSKAWSFFSEATPGKPNRGDIAVHGRTATPTIDTAFAGSGDLVVLPLIADEGATIRYTTDGTEPTALNGHTYAGPLTIDHDLVVRARAFVEGHLPSKEFCSTYHLGDAPQVGITIAMDQAGLSDDSIGINVEGALANFSRRGRTWERLAMVKFNGTEDAPIPIGISIHGSGSRGLAKRSFKLHARDRYDSPVKGLRLNETEFFQEGILRADAGAHTFLRNRFMEVIATKHHLHVDVQPSRPMPLYLNGQYWGLYRWMPPKDEQWLERISGSEAVDVLEGPAAVVRSGSDAHFKPAVERLMALAPLDTLARYFDLDNLIDLACLDLYTGRADHDLNVRLYRPRQHGGRWRWVMFDMDLWAPAEENGVERMASGTAAETPYIPQLLQQPELQQKLLARMTALIATALSPAEAASLADSLFASHSAAMQADHERWRNEMERPDPSASYADLRGFTQQRPAHVMQDIAARTGRKLKIITVEVPSTEVGVLKIEGLTLSPGVHEVMAFNGVPIQFNFGEGVGQELAGWKGTNEAGATIKIEPSNLRVLRPLVRPSLP